MACFLEYVLLGLSFPFVFTVEARACEYNEYAIESKSGNLTCLACRSCPQGFGLFPQCGKQIKDNGPRNECKPCQLGKTYSAHDGIGSCEPCGSCADHQTILKNCTLVSDSQCNDTCSKGFYFEDLTGDCHPCSWCCSDGSNKVRSGCNDMPFYKQCDVNTAKDCKPKCQNDQYVVPGSKGGGHCKDCKVCPPGTAPFPECGSEVKNISKITCKQCIKGRTYSPSHGKHSCWPCTRCSIRQKEVSPCNLETDRVCSYCKKGFYRDVNSNKCKRCSACCNNHRDQLIDECIEQNMPKNWHCGYINRKEGVCSHSNFIGMLVGTLAGGVVTSIAGVFYLWWKFCKKGSIIHAGLDGSNPFLVSNEEGGDREATFEGQKNQPENFISFDNSGVIVRFNDPDSLPHEVQGIRSEICWNEVLPITLLSDEVQLSPVIQFHPLGLKLSNPVCVTMPHSALVTSSHGWNIGLKSAVFNDGAVVWDDKTVDRIDADDLSFHADCLLSYVVVGTQVRNSYPTKKRFYCAVFGGQGKVGPNYTAYLYLFDECEASLRKIIQDERSRKRMLLSSLHSLHVESARETDVKVAIKQLSGGWKIASTNPQVISHMSLKQSYKTFPCVEMIFSHDNGQNGEFRCTFELMTDDTTIQICVVTPLMEDPAGNYKESGTCQYHLMVTEQGEYASKPLESLVHDLSDSVEKICRRLDTRIQGAGHYEVIAHCFGFDLYDVRSTFETSVSGPSRAMIEAIVVRHPELTVEKFARVVEEKAHRKDVADLLRAYDRDSLKQSV